MVIMKVAFVIEKISTCVGRYISRPVLNLLGYRDSMRPQKRIIFMKKKKKEWIDGEFMKYITKTNNILYTVDHKNI